MTGDRPFETSTTRRRQCDEQASKQPTYQAEVLSARMAAMAVIWTAASSLPFFLRSMTPSRCCGPRVSSNEVSVFTTRSKGHTLVRRIIRRRTVRRRSRKPGRLNEMRRRRRILLFHAKYKCRLSSRLARFPKPCVDRAPFDAAV